MMPTILSILQKYYSEEKKKVFCRFIKSNEQEDITYSELIERASSYAEHFRQNGIKKGDCVIIILKHSPHLFYSFVGSMIIGAIPSILPFPSEKQDIELHRNSIERLCGRIKAKSIVTYEENIPEMELIKKDLGIYLITPKEIVRSTSVYFEDVDQGDIALLQHSSGTTGLKKGVALSHSAILNQIGSYSRAIDLNEKDVIVSWLPLYHDMGLIACFLLPLIKGVKVVMMDPFEWVLAPQMIFDQIESNNGTLCWLPNFAFNFMVNCIDTQTQKYDLSKMKAFIDCSEPCKPHSFEIFYESFKKYGVRKEHLQTCYAMAENVFAITQSELGKKIKTDKVSKSQLSSSHVAILSDVDYVEFLSVGKVINNTEVFITDEKKNNLPQRHIGEIKIRSDCLFFGYFKLPEESTKVIENGYFYTGDLGYVADGELYITGRKKDLIIVHGKNYYAHDIEYIVNHIHGIKKGRVVAIPIENEKMGSEEAIVIAEILDLSEHNKQAIAKEIKKRVSEELNLTLKDAYLVPLKWIVKTTSGKISRNENKRKYLREKFKISE